MTTPETFSDILLDDIGLGFVNGTVGSSTFHFFKGICLSLTSRWTLFTGVFEIIEGSLVMLDMELSQPASKFPRFGGGEKEEEEKKKKSGELKVESGGLKGRN
ncbi:hypothetical protein Fot_05459 [Forsythia ovata]|uniref:Uncharacterized protein n=1 Tax=Forsythia ovata TaxID=205694 RepID=A0ABD1WU68_9LAMI